MTRFLRVISHHRSTRCSTNSSTTTKFSHVQFYARPNFVKLLISALRISRYYSFQFVDASLKSSIRSFIHPLLIRSLLSNLCFSMLGQNIIIFHPTPLYYGHPTLPPSLNSFLTLEESCSMLPLNRCFHDTIDPHQLVSSFFLPCCFNQHTVASTLASSAEDQLTLPS